uniref:Complement component n=1 Tax=Riptortus pedestris TaxID=329032 RepID=R4WP07_RIPPE|nr:complement component [Riptortus pedestris]
MSVLIKNALRLPVLKSAGKLLGTNTVSNMTKLQPRCMWQVSSNTLAIFHHKCNSFGQCTCSYRKVHSLGGNFLSKAATEVAGKTAFTQGEKELAEFLDQEIAAERKLQKIKKIPTEVDGYKVKLDGSEVTLIKVNGDETIEINFNINHTVDTDPVEPDIEPTMDKPELGEMKSRPTFEVEIRRGGKTLGFTCSTVSPSHNQGQQDESYNDLFMIDEVVMYDGEWKDSNYSVSGEVLDGTLYDLFMNLLEDKGINNEFVDKVIEISTAYEHDNYVRMLEDIQRFVTPK